MSEEGVSCHLCDIHDAQLPCNAGASYNKQFSEALFTFKESIHPLTNVTHQLRGKTKRRRKKNSRPFSLNQSCNGGPCATIRVRPTTLLLIVFTNHCSAILSQCKGVLVACLVLPGCRSRGYSRKQSIDGVITLGQTSISPTHHSSSSPQLQNFTIQSHVSVGHF